METWGRKEPAGLRGLVMILRHSVSYGGQVLRDLFVMADNSGGWINSRGHVRDEGRVDEVKMPIPAQGRAEGFVRYRGELPP